MATIASMINLEYSNRLVFAIPVPEWSIQHELLINSSTSWIKYPSPKGWNWLKLPLNENYEIIGLSTPEGLKSPEGIILDDDEIFGTIIRSHIITNANKYHVIYIKTGVYLVLEMYL
jgi:hypothetical protein